MALRGLQLVRQVLKQSCDGVEKSSAHSDLNMTMHERACSAISFRKHVRGTPSFCKSFAAAIMAARKDTRNTLKALPDIHN